MKTKIGQRWVFKKNNTNGFIIGLTNNVGKYACGIIKQIIDEEYSSSHKEFLTKTADWDLINSTGKGEEEMCSQKFFLLCGQEEEQC